MRILEVHVIYSKKEIQQQQKILSVENKINTIFNNIDFADITIKFKHIFSLSESMVIFYKNITSSNDRLKLPAYFIFGDNKPMHYSPFTNESEMLNNILYYLPLDVKSKLDDSVSKNMIHIVPSNKIGGLMPQTPFYSS